MAKNLGPIRVKITGNAIEDERYLQLAEDLRLPLLSPVLPARWLEVSRDQPALPVGATVRRVAVSGVLVRDIVLAAGLPNVIPHRLGRSLEGWWVVDKNANTNVWADDPATLTPAETAATALVLRCSLDVTVRVMVL